MFFLQNALQKLFLLYTLVIKTTQPEKKMSILELIILCGLFDMNATIHNDCVQYSADNGDFIAFSQSQDFVTIGKYEAGVTPEFLHVTASTPLAKVKHFVEEIL